MLSRRELLALAAGAAGLARWQGVSLAASQAWRVDFSALAPGEGWPGFACVGVANLRRKGGEGVLEAGSDVFPNDPRPVAFAVDRRFTDGSVGAVVTRSGAGAGVVLRRTSPRDYYAAVYDEERAALLIVRRTGTEVVERARAVAAPVRLPATVTLEATGTGTTRLRATLADADGRVFTASALDSHEALQGPGDPGVFATARTLFPSERNELFPALGNTHLLPYGVQEGQAFLESPAGQPIIGAIRERSTATFREITVSTAAGFGATAPSVVAATTGLPGKTGATVQVATDLPARVSIEVAGRPDFRGARRIKAGSTGEFEAAAERVSASGGEQRVWWRARVARAGRTVTGPVRSFPALPAEGGAREVSVAIAACASQFGPIFDELAERRPDAFVWQGDLNYPDTHGPLAQSASGYAGIWRDFLANPRLAPVLERTCFVPRRDDHDYGVQDAHSKNLKPYGVEPWDALMGAGDYHRFRAGAMEVWVLDQRLFKSPPDRPDTVSKTLLGAEQRRWLFDTLAGSRAPFKVICSPCTLSPVQRENTRDGNWSAGYTAERDLLLRHIRERVGGRTIFVTGDTHYTMVYDRGGLFEARPCPLDIPTPNDITLVDPLAAQELRERPGVVYADDRRGHYALLQASVQGETARLELALIREDGTAGFSRRFEEPLSEAADTGGSGADGDGDGAGGGEGSGTARAGRGEGSGGLPFTGGHPLSVAVAGALAAATGAVARRLSGSPKPPDAG